MGLEKKNRNLFNGLRNGLHEKHKKLLMEPENAISTHLSGSSKQILNQKYKIYFLEDTHRFVRGILYPQWRVNFLLTSTEIENVFLVELNMYLNVTT